MSSRAEIDHPWGWNMAGKVGIPVTERALIQRINRVLRRDGRILKVTRAEQAVREVGQYYVLGLDRNAVRTLHVDIQELARELGVLRSFERLEETPRA
jgi:hypothetical protein